MAMQQGTRRYVASSDDSSSPSAGRLVNWTNRHCPKLPSAETASHHCAAARFLASVRSVSCHLISTINLCPESFSLTMKSGR